MFELKEDLYINILMNVMEVSLIISVSNVIGRYAGKRIVGIFAVLSYASMCAYLFHRTLYKVFKMIFADSEGNIPLYIAPIMVLSLFCVAYIIQKGYDELTNRIKIV